MMGRGPTQNLKSKNQLAGLLTSSPASAGAGRGRFLETSQEHHRCRSIWLAIAIGLALVCQSTAADKKLQGRSRFEDTVHGDGVLLRLRHVSAARHTGSLPDAPDRDTHSGEGAVGRGEVHDLRAIQRELDEGHGCGGSTWDGWHSAGRGEAGGTPGTGLAGGRRLTASPLPPHSTAARAPLPAPAPAPAPAPQPVDLPVLGYFLKEGVYYTELELGQSSQLFRMQLDTGSDLLWALCSCPGCGMTQPPPPPLPPPPRRLVSPPPWAPPPTQARASPPEDLFLLPAMGPLEFSPAPAPSPMPTPTGPQSPTQPPRKSGQKQRQARVAPSPRAATGPGAGAGGTAPSGGQGPGGNAEAGGRAFAVYKPRNSSQVLVNCGQPACSIYAGSYALQSPIGCQVQPSKCPIGCQGPSIA